MDERMYQNRTVTEHMFIQEQHEAAINREINRRLNEQQPPLVGPMDQVVPSEWLDPVVSRCEYCGGKSKKDDLKCQNCGAPL